MKIGIGQINPTLGDFAGNAEKIAAYASQASQQNCELAVFPELSLFGYPPFDLLDRPDVVKEQLKVLKALHKKIPKGLPVVIGAVMPNSGKGKAYVNAAILLEKGKKPRVFAKTLLPTYDVFDEVRHFEAGDLRKNIVSIGSRKILITICEDIWAWGSPWPGANYAENPLKAVSKKGVKLVLNISASPFSRTHFSDRVDCAQKAAKLLKAPVLYVNTVGAQDELIFDGGSFLFHPKSALMARAPFFKENLLIVDTEEKKKNVPILPDRMTILRDALVTGIRDFAKKTGHTRVHLGLSGGIDSALVCALACKAVGPENVTAVALPGPYSTDLSFTAAEKLVKNLGCAFETVSIVKTYETVSETLRKEMGVAEFGLIHENVQARLRGLFLMAFSNKTQSLLLSTGNKSEYAAGYTTLYGDMTGGLAVIGDLVKRDVYSLSRSFNKDGEIIPSEILDRAPSAELRPNQKDQDTLPPYDDLDRAVENLVESGKTARTEAEKWLLPRLMRSEFKRWQAPPILRVSTHAFGRGRRYPIAHKSLF